MVKNKGSRPEEQLVPLQRAASMLKIGKSTLQRMSRRGIIQPVYKEGGREGHFRMHDLSALAEALEMKIDLHTVADMAMQAFVTSKGTAKRVDDLYYLLGLGKADLGTTEEEVVALYVRVQEARN